MRSAILISENNKEIEHLFQQWKNKAKKMYVDSHTLSMVINGERIYIDYCEKGELCYEGGELANVDLSTPSFYLIRYSDRDTMKYFIKNSVFNEGSFLDNDLGKIVRLDELRKGEILNFIE